MNDSSQLVEVCSDSVFYIHTYRCKHAGDEDDELEKSFAVEV